MTLDELKALVKAEVATAMNSCAEVKDDEVKNEEPVEETTTPTEDKEDKAEETAAEKTETADGEQPAEVEDKKKTADEVKEEKTEEVVKEEALNSSPVAVETKLNPLETLKGAALWSYVNKHPYGI